MCNECPICYDAMDSANNQVTTECGHKFHTSCLLKNTARNGYGCPMCRSTMVENVVDDEDDRSYHYDGENDADYGDDDDDRFDEQEHALVLAQRDHYVLDGFRWLFQRAEHGEIYENDPYVDTYENWNLQIHRNMVVFDEEIEAKWPVILSELEKIKGLTYEDLLKGYLFNIDENFGSSTKYKDYDKKATSTLRSIINRTENRV